MTAPYQAIRCADGFMTLAGANDRLFRRLCELLGHAEWADDPDYVDDTARVRNRTKLAALIESETRKQPRAH
jgi:formyl-CoA transferase